MKLSNQNLENLENIREIIEVEEGVNVTPDEALERVLGFYKKYVPYN